MGDGAYMALCAMEAYEDYDALYGHGNVPYRKFTKPYCKKTAKARIQAHKKFDLLWCFGHMTRDEAYKWLAEAMKLPKSMCHIRQFGILDCKRVEAKVEQYWEEYRDKETAV